MLCESCGEHHADCTTRIYVGRDAARRMNDWLREGGYSSVMVVADINTEPAARALLAELCGIDTQLYVYGDPSLVPDETAIGKLLIATDAISAADAIGATGADTALVAVGSGTLNDLTRYVAYRLGLPYYVYATAASMDGYTSSVAPLIVSGGLKMTYPAVAPLGVAGDTAVLATAPVGMTAAGYGDIMGKWTSTHDWELENIVTGGAYCAKLAGDMRAIAAHIMDVASEDAAAVLDALLQSGLVMQMAGHSKPASGSEHHLSHFWEMMALMRGQIPALHGAKVGVATLAALRVNEWLLSETPDWDRVLKAADRYDSARSRDEILRVFGRAADGILAQWPEDTVIGRQQTINAVRTHWEDILCAIRRNLPPRETVETGLMRMGCPMRPADIRVDHDDFINGVLHAWRIRPRFTVWRIVDALGMLSEYAGRLWEEMR